LTLLDVVAAFDTLQSSSRCADTYLVGTVGLGEGLGTSGDRLGEGLGLSSSGDVLGEGLGTSGDALGEGLGCCGGTGGL
jgi:cytolysin (calcineurin-like family phosphatase)